MPFRVRSTISAFAVLLLAGCMMSEPSGIEYTCTPPDVIQIGPGPGAEDVPLDADVTVTFTVPMDSGSFDSSSLILTLGNDTVEGEVSFDPGDTTLTFDPTDSLLPDTTYTVTLTTEFTDSLGFTLDTTYTWTFTTEDGDPDPPAPPDGIGDVFPKDGGEDVPIDGNITVIFDYPVDSNFFDDTTTFILTLGDDTIPGEIHYYPEDTGVVFIPDDPLLPDTTYTAIVHYPVDEPAGPLGPPPDTTYTWTFTTEDTIPDPVPHDTVPAPGPPVPRQQGMGAYDFTHSPPPNLNLYWFPVSDAVTYRLQVSTGPLFINTVFDQAGIAQNAPTVFQPVPISLLPTGTYYWRVNAVNAGGTSLWSVVKSFTVTQ